MTSEKPHNGGEQTEEVSGGTSTATGFYVAAVVTILVLYGLLGSPDNARSFGININLWWGSTTVVFGVVILGMSLAPLRRRAARGGNR